MSIFSKACRLSIEGLQIVVDKKKKSADSKRESAPYVIKADKRMIVTVFDFVIWSLSDWQTGPMSSDRIQIRSTVC